VKKNILCFVFMIFLGFSIFAQENNDEIPDDVSNDDVKNENVGHDKARHDNVSPPSLLLIFHDIGWNTLHSFTCNYGLNFIGAGLGTWAFIATDIDWKWRNLAYDNTWLSNMGRPGLYIGYVVPALAPVITYATGRIIEDNKLQITGMALLQTLMITLAVQTPLKMITGRALPGIVTELDHTRNPSTDNISGEFNWFNKNPIGGWPSAHTAQAFAAAAAISEIYSDNTWLKAGAYAYAAIIGFGVTVNVHWASEALAGALIGYAIGSTVGKSYKKLLDKNSTEDNVSFYFSPNGAGVIIKY
jgi:membrane-associated phospholipid phosphatase